MIHIYDTEPAYINWTWPSPHLVSATYACIFDIWIITTCLLPWKIVFCEDCIICAPLACPVAYIPAGDVIQADNRIRAFLLCSLPSLCWIFGRSCSPHPQLVPYMWTFKLWNSKDSNMHLHVQCQGKGEWNCSLPSISCCWWSQLCHLPVSNFSPGSNSSCQFTQCQSLYGSCQTVVV